MNEKRDMMRRFWRTGLVPWLPAVGQLATLVVVATVLLLPAPFIQNQLPAVWSGSDLTTSHWPTALLIQRTFVQKHQLPLWALPGHLQGDGRRAQHVLMLREDAQGIA